MAGRLETLMSGDGDGGTEIQYMRYDYDAVGNMQQRIDDRFFDREIIDEFQYDAVNRLTLSELTYTDDIATYNVVDYDITYDEAGRRESLAELNSPSLTYTYNTASIHGVDSTSDGKTYLYDNVGNQTLSAGRTLEYTAFNKVSRISNGVEVVEYLYGPNNEKILKAEQAGGETNLTWYVGGVEVIIEGWSNGVPERLKTKRYIGNALVTHHDVYNIDINYMHSDHLGSLQAITQQNHHINGVHHLSYDAFGKRRNALIPDGKYSFFSPVSNITDKGFTGQDHIDQMSLINFNARLYDPNLGMMLQADTIIPDGPALDSVNRYAYVYNNPLSYTDPSGHLPSPFGISLGRGFNIWYNLMQVKLPADATDSDFGVLDKESTPEGVSGGAFGNGDTGQYALGFHDDGQGWNGTQRPGAVRPQEKQINEEPGFWDVAWDEVKSFGNFAVNAPGVVLNTTGNWLASFEGEANTLATALGPYGKGAKVGIAGFGTLARGMAYTGKAMRVGNNSIKTLSRSGQRMQGPWKINDLKQSLLGHPPRSLGSPDIHHIDQMPGSGIDEILPSMHRGNKSLHPNRFNQGVTKQMRRADRELHWWYRAREQGADDIIPNWIYDR